MALGLTPIQIIEKGTHPLLVKDETWERIELKYIAKVQNGYAFSSKLFNREIGLPLIRIRDIFSAKTQNLYSGEYKEDFIVKNGDLLIGMDGDFKISKWPGTKGLLNQRVCRILFFSKYFEKEFLFLCIQPYLDAIHSETSSVTVKHLSSRTINNIPFPLPPLPIQRAIVSKMESLFTSLDRGIDDLKKAQAQLVIYRQAVLKKAFEGELTAAWRAEQKDLPTVDELLEEIKVEREKQYELELEKWQRSMVAWEKEGKESKKPNKPSKLGLVEFSNDVKMDNLPKGWCNLTLAHIKQFSIYGPRYSSKDYSDEGTAVLRTSDINNNGKVDWVNSPKLKLSDYDYEKYKLIQNDFLITRTGSIGRVSVFNDNKKAIPGAFLIHYRLIKKINIWYILKYFQSFDAQQHLIGNSAGVGRPNLNVPNIEKLLIPLPSLKEQNQIVREIESRLSVCDKVEESIQVALKKAEAFRQSILKKAFEGKLLTAEEIAHCKAEADYEPASVLLERIKAEKK